jgi:hypothetical protein
MMEREPEIPKFILNIGEEKVVCTPENTLAFLYEDEQYDHIFHITKQENDMMYGFHIFRHLLGNDFDILVRRMIDGGYAVSNEEEISESDLEAYKKSLPVEAHYQDLTPRQERLVEFLAYILDKEHLVAEDFNGKNELYI